MSYEVYEIVNGDTPITESGNDPITDLEVAKRLAREASMFPTNRDSIMRVRVRVRYQPPEISHDREWGPTTLAAFVNGEERDAEAWARGEETVLEAIRAIDADGEHGRELLVHDVAVRLDRPSGASDVNEEIERLAAEGIVTILADVDQGPTSFRLNR